MHRGSFRSQPERRPGTPADTTASPSTSYSRPSPPLPNIEHPSSSPSPRVLRHSQAIREHTKRLGKTQKSISRLERFLFSQDDLSLEREMELETFLSQSKAKAAELTSLDLSKTSVAARLLLNHSAELGVEVELVSRLALKDATLLLVKPLELKARALLLASAFGFGSDLRAVMDLAIENPSLLSRSSASLARNLPNMSALFKSRGLSLAEMSRMQPDLLLQAPGTLRNKMDAIPAALDMPPRRARDLVAACPQLLRRSTTTLHGRFKLLQQIFDSVPRNFLSELVLQEPRILCYSSMTMREKFAVLLSRYGSFQDDVVDMILVDPNVLLKAKPSKQQEQVSKKRDESTAVKVSSVKERKHLKHVPPSTMMTGVENLAALSKEMDADLMQVVELVLQSSVGALSPVGDVEEMKAGDVALKLTSLANSLGIQMSEAQNMVKSEPLLFLLPLPILSDRSLQLSKLSTSTRSLALSHPKLLLKDPMELERQIKTIQQLLGLSSVEPLITKCPEVLIIDDLHSRLSMLSQVLGNNSSFLLIAELVVREPRLLIVPLEDIRAAFESLAESFGSFREDALQIVLADPASLLVEGTAVKRSGEKESWSEGERPNSRPRSRKQRGA